MSKAVREKVANGTHHFLGENNPSHKRIENGTHNFLGGNIQKKNNKKKVENGTHNFLGGEIQRKRIENGTHNLLGPENNRKRIENGTHHLLSKNRVTALNIETNEVHNIPTELYHSRRDIYFANTSKAFKEWKKNKDNK